MQSTDNGHLVNSSLALFSEALTHLTADLVGDPLPWPMEREQFWMSVWARADEMPSHDQRYLHQLIDSVKRIESYLAQREAQPAGS